MRKRWHTKGLSIVKIILPAILIIFCHCAVAHSDNVKVTQIKDKILSLALESQRISDNMEARIALENAIERIDTLGLQDDDLLSLYIELLDYYIGEHPGGILLEKITRMREKILPFLVEKKNMPLMCSEKYKSLCSYKDIKERNIKIIVAIDAIKKDVVLYEEYPENLRSEILKNVNILKIFIEDYKKVKGILPNDLDTLWKYAWDTYGYKLQIWNPWAENGMIKYEPRKNGKYILDAGFSENLVQ